MEGFNETTSHQRFQNRIRLFRILKKPVALHHFWWFVHNCVAHPLIGLIPIRVTFEFHDFTSRKINAR